MKFAEKVIPYLTGDKFSNALSVKFQGSDPTEKTRTELLKDLARGKKVLHIGFADHYQLIPIKVEQKTWLHKHLVEVAQVCLGVDIDELAVEFCKTQLKIDHLYLHNVVDDEPLEAIVSQQWDVAILGEVIEHVQNPGVFLESLHKKYGASITWLVITAPNAWELNNIVNIRRNTEFINSDHRFWFTPYTLSKIAAGAGMEIEKFFFVNASPEKRLFRRLLQKKYPMLRDTLVGIYRCK